MSDTLYIGILKPTEVRRTLLESSRSVLKALQAYEDMRELRKEKMKILYLLREQVLDVQKLNRELRKKLPKANASPLEKKKEAKKKKSNASSLAEVSNLENELASIEEEIDKLEA